VRHGISTRFAALNVPEGKVIGGCFERHRHEEFLKLLRQIDRQTPPELKPFVWTKRVQAILEKVRHCKAASVTQH
jgi:hypothetical protein